MSEAKHLYAIVGTTFLFESGGLYSSHFTDLYKSYRKASQTLIDCGFTPYFSKKSSDPKGDLCFYLSKLDDGVQLEYQIVKLRMP